MNPTFYFGSVKKGETLEEVYTRDRPRVPVVGFGIATQVSISRVDLCPMSRIEAIGYLHSNAMTWMPAKAVRISENPDNVEWMWGVWIAAPDDFFVEGTSEAYMTPHMIENYRQDAIRSREKRHDEHVIFLRV
jgi:hypothetical protein